MSPQSRPLLVLTRPEAPAERFTREARARLGADLPVLIAPLMAPQFLTPELPSQRPEGVIFTSETGVAALSRQVAWRGAAICVGPRTAEAADAEGWQAEVMGGDAEGLLAGLIARPLHGIWLHARGRDAAGQLGPRARAAGLQIDEHILYSQEPQPPSAALRHVLTGTAPLLVPIFSPRSGRLFAAAARALGADLAAPLAFVAISAAARETVDALRAYPTQVAATPDAEGMLDALESACRMLEGLQPPPR